MVARLSPTHTQKAAFIVFVYLMSDVWNINIYIYIYIYIHMYIYVYIERERRLSCEVGV